MNDWQAIAADFVARELPHGRFDVGSSPVLAAVGTIAEIALANPLLREPLAAAHFTPSAYLPFATPEGLFSSAAWQLALVISPFKRRVVICCTSLAPAALATGVVDTLVRHNGHVLGLNTNVYAAGAALRCLLRGDEERVLVIGTGASARSVLQALTTWYARLCVGVYGRSVEHATQLATDFAASVVGHPSEFGADAIVHATTVGERDDATTLDASVETALAPGVRLFDLTNRLSALQTTALKRGCVVVSGNLMQRITNTLRAASIHSFS